ncbi:H-NS histone family protein [Rhodobacterales bacterium HKCCSP123]|nr:H-NS histone family protein [Rhodobacterales bacterium HKCCSP123]
MSLEKMTLEELKQHQKDIEKAIKTFEARKLAEARVALEKQAEKLGVKLSDVVGGSSTTAKSVSPPKYMHPENPEKTWTGRGRKPKWIEEGLAAGKKLEDFLIK